MPNNRFLAEISAIARFAGRVFREELRPRYEVRELLYQCYVIGYQSLPLVGITRDLRQITGKLNGSKALWQLLNDQTLATSVHQSLGNVSTATRQLRDASQDVQALTRGMRQGRGPIGYLLTDKAFAGQLGHAAG